MARTRVYPGSGLRGGASGPRQRRVVVVAAALLCLGAVAWTWQHPSDLFTDTDEVTVERTVGEPVWTSLSLLAYGPLATDVPGSITITGLQPVVERDGAAVEVDYLICEMDLDPAADGAFGGGMPPEAVDRYCLETRAAQGSTYHFRAEPHEELLVGLTPTRPGTTVVTGHQVSYDVGWQRGDDLIDLELRVRAD